MSCCSSREKIWKHLYSCRGISSKLQAFSKIPSKDNSIVNKVFRSAATNSSGNGPDKEIGDS